MEERHPHRMCVGGSIPSAWVMEEFFMNAEIIGSYKDIPAVIFEPEKYDMYEQIFKTEMVKHRCQHCNRLLGKFNGQAEIKCPKCGKINRIGVK